MEVITLKNTEAEIIEAIQEAEYNAVYADLNNINFWVCEARRLQELLTMKHLEDILF